MVAADLGGHFQNVSTVNPGNGGRNPFDNALSMVELAGENNVACANSTKFSGLAVLRTALLVEWGGMIARCHNPQVCGSR